MLWLCVGTYRGNSTKGFLIFLKAQIERETEEYIYKIYTADAIATGVNALAKLGGAESVAIENRYIDLIKHKNKADVPKASDIINNVIEIGHLEVID